MTKQKHNPYTIGIVQMRCTPERAQNMAHAIDMIEMAKAQGAEVVCLPELFLGYYFCQEENHEYFNLAEPVPGPASEELSAAAKRLGIVIVASVFERAAAGLYYNTAFVIDADGKYLGKYRKMHIPDDPLFLEKFYFTPGDLGFKVFDTKFGRIGTLVCWDQWYPEAARLTAMMGADVIFYPTAIGWHPKEKTEFGTAQSEAWQAVQRGHAIANGVYVASPNRIGHEIIVNDGIEFFGHSFIFDPFGRPLAKAGHAEETVLTATIDPALVEETRRHWPFLRDRRIDAYTAIPNRWLGNE